MAVFHSPGSLRCGPAVLVFGLLLQTDACAPPPSARDDRRSDPPRADPPARLLLRRAPLESEPASNPMVHVNSTPRNLSTGLFPGQQITLKFTGHPSVLASLPWASLASSLRLETDTGESLKLDEAAVARPRAGDAPAGGVDSGSDARGTVRVALPQSLQGRQGWVVLSLDLPGEQVRAVGFDRGNGATQQLRLRLGSEPSIRTVRYARGPDGSSKVSFDLSEAVEVGILRSGLGARLGGGTCVPPQHEAEISQASLWSLSCAPGLAGPLSLAITDSSGIGLGFGATRRSGALEVTEDVGSDAEVVLVPR